MEDACSSVKKAGGSKVFHSQSREIVHNVYRYFKQEYSVESNYVIQQRASKATGVSVSSIKRLLKES